MIEIISSKIVKIRKNHICKGCGKSMHKGNFSSTWQCMIGSKYFGVHWCLECARILDKLAPVNYLELQNKIFEERFNPNFRAFVDMNCF